MKAHLRILEMDSPSVSHGNYLTCRHKNNNLGILV